MGDQDVAAVTPELITLGWITETILRNGRAGEGEKQKNSSSGPRGPEEKCEHYGKPFRQLLGGT